MGVHSLGITPLSGLDTAPLSSGLMTEALDDLQMAIIQQVRHFRCTLSREGYVRVPLSLGC